MKLQLRRWLRAIISAAAIAGLFLGGCATSSADSSTTTSASSTTATGNRSITAQASNINMSELPQLQGKATVVMTVKGQPITIEVDGENAPTTAGNFVDLVRRKVYDGLVFHRVVTAPQPFVAQGGDPQGKDPNFPIQRLGTGSFVDPDSQEPRYIPLEITPEGASEPVYGKTLKQAEISEPPVLSHNRGAVAMARSQMPNSASAQFYFALADLKFLDGDYAVFGYVRDGMDVVDAIQQGDRIDSARVTAGAENLKTANSN